MTEYISTFPNLRLGAVEGAWVRNSISGQNTLKIRVLSVDKRLAQLAEHRSYEPKVVGSKPSSFNPQVRLLAMWETTFAQMTLRIFDHTGLPNREWPWSENVVSHMAFQRGVAQITHSFEKYFLKPFAQSSKSCMASKRRLCNAMWRPQKKNARFHDHSRRGII